MKIDLYNGDCIELFKNIKDSTIDCIITSPPYNYDMNYNTYEDSIDWETYFDWLDKVWNECYRVLKDDGRLIINIQPNWSNYMPTHHIIFTRIMNLGFKFKSEIIWEKNNYNCGFCTWGSWKSPSMPYMKYTWEFVEVFVKNNYKHIGNKECADITEDEFKMWTTAKWNIAPEHRMKQFNHPAMFPEELPKRLIKLFTFVGDTILDPFMGAGTTGVVCKNLKRNFIGFELDRKYFETSQQRIEGKIIIKDVKEENESSCVKENIIKYDFLDEI